MVSCVFPVGKNLIVRTRSEKVDRIRKMILELLMAHAPDAFELLDLAKEYGTRGIDLKKRPPFAFIADYACGIAPR